MLNTGRLEGRKENIPFTDIIPLLEQRDKYLLTATLKSVNKSEKVLLREKIITHKGKLFGFSVWVWGFFGWWGKVRYQTDRVCT